MSPLINPDLKELAPIEPGTYKAKIDTVTAGMSKSDNPKIVVKFTVDANGKQKTRMAHLVITGDGAFNFEQLLRACHFDDVANRLRNGERVPFDTDQLQGQELNLVFESDTYNGAPTDKITHYLKA